MRHSIRKEIRRFLCFLMTFIMILTSMPVHLLAAYDYKDLTKDKSEIINNKTPVKVAKPEADKTAADLIKNPDQPAIYTLRTDYKVQKGDKYEINYQPYVASVGEAASDAEKAKVKKEITLPDLAGYDKSHLDDTFTITYDTVKNAANGKNETGDKTNGLKYSADEDFRYKAKSNSIKIKHLFQDMKDFTKYTNPGGEDKPEKITEQNGNTGSTMEVSPLNENDRRGFVPESDFITMRVPEDATDFMLEYRYNRAHYNVDFDTMGGTALPTRTYYYDQEIPKIDEKSIPTKEGCVFKGWMPSHEIKDKDGKNYPKGQIINKADGKPALDLDVHLKMPALLLGTDIKSRERLKFTAVWEDKEKADYAIQFWAEKADHADGASLLDKYDYMGTRVYKDKDTGSTPELDKEPVNGLKFPDLDQARLNKIWANAKFNRGRILFLNKFFVYNKKLTDEQNLDSKTNVTKTVSATGKTVYNIYYDRQVYDLYFTKSNAQPDKNTIYPEIWGYDPAKGEAVMLGGPGNLYHYKARFNEMMYKWPNDAKQTKGFTPGYQSFGWGPNYSTPYWPLHLDTPPYRLNADEFLDMAEYTNKGGYTKHIDKGDGTSIDLDRFDFTTLSFGIKQDKPSIPHHMDFWMDGFKDGETIIRYDFVRTKADTSDPRYGHRYPIVTGFTPYGYNPKEQWPSIREDQQEDGRVDGDRIDELNDERDDITLNTCGTYYNNDGIKLPIGQLDFISHFYSDYDEFGDVKEGAQEFTENGYLQFKYKRNKYPLRFNYDPSKIKDDSEFNSTNQLDTFYEFPLKALNPGVDEDDEYKKVGTKEGPKNLLDNPENLKKLGLSDLVFTDSKDGKLKVKRPEGLSDQMVFKGWALDPAGTKLVWENPKETMPFHPLNLYAKWGEPDYKWKVTFDPDGGKLRNIKEENLTEKRKTIQEGDIGQEEVNTYAKKGYLKEDPTTPDGKQIFTVIQRQKLVEPAKPERKGYDFMGWEVVRYKKDNKGDYTDEVDTSYRDKYGVPELYTFGNEVVGPVYLKAIWNPNQRVDVKVVHHILDKDCKKDKEITEWLEDKRTGYYTATVGDKQGETLILAPNEELEKTTDEKIKELYKKYNDEFKFNNTYFQNQRIEPEKIKDPNTGEMIDNPAYKGNEFHFFYRPFRQREYKVNYIDERFKGKETEDGADIIKQELVKNGNRHYDARNYRQIPGWKLVSAPQQQLFFDVNEKTNEFLGINGTGKKEITFYYKDVRVIEVPGNVDPPKGYVRVTYKIDEKDKGGAFTDKDGKSVKELHYDVIKGLKSDLLPVPQELKDGEEKVAGKYYVTPETGKKFTKWDNKPLLNKNTIINEAHEFTAYFEWSGLTASGLVRTEAFKDSENKWTNDFAPTIDQLKAQLVWKEKDEVKPLPKGTEIKLYDENNNELTSDDQVYKLVNEKGKADKEQLVRTVNVKAKVTFKTGKDPQELDIPITVYKNVYEALNKAGDKPLFLKEAEGKKAEEGGLKDVTGDYVMVTIKADKDFNAKDDKIYWVNKNAWVEIPEVKTEGSSTFVNWTADKDAQNENGIFDFGKRHKFTEDTVISPSDAKDVVEQTDPNKKPDVPNSYVKVIVDKTTNAELGADEKQTQTFWVNPTKEVTIPVASPKGKEKQKVTIEGLGEKEVNYVFKEWQKVKAGEADDKLKEVKPVVEIDLAKNKFTDKVTVIEAAYKKSIQSEKIENPLKTTKLDTPQGKEITNDDLIKQITPQEGKEIESIEVISKPDGNTVGDTPAKVIVKYKDGTTQGTTDKPVVIPVEVHKNIIPEAPGGQKPKDAMDNYVKVTFKAGKGGSVSGDLVYYVSPEVEVNMTSQAEDVTKKPSIGYTSNGGTWSPEIKSEKITTEKTYEFNFVKSKDIVEKTNDPNQVIPEGYVKVTFKTEDENKGKLEGDKLVKICYVNPNAGIKLVELNKGTKATEKQLAVPKTSPATNYEFDKWYEEIDTETAITSERIHVAKFKLAKVTLTYEAGEGAKGEVPAKVEVDHGTKVRLARPDKLSKDNATFAGWKIGDKTYQPGDQVTLNGNTTATAQWTATKHTVTFDTKGGSEVPKQEVVHEGKLAKFDNPTLKDKVFMGWKEKGKENEKAYFDLTKPITQDKTLIAIWQDPVQKIDENSTVEDKFIKVTFKEGEHGKLKLDKAEQTSPVTYKVAKDYNFDQAVKAGLKVPEIVPAKYYKSNGWDNALELAGQNIEFTAQYEPQADVIPVDPKVTDEDQIKNEKPEGMVLVTFKVDEKKAYMLGDTRFYVKKDEVVNIETPLVRRLELGDGIRNDYVFKGWDLKTLGNEWKFSDDTTIGDGTQVKPTITIIIPSAGDPEVSVESMTKDAKAYLEVTRSNKTTKIEAIYDEDYGMYFFEIPDDLGGQLKKRDKIKVYAELDGIRSDTREYRVK